MKENSEFMKGAVKILAMLIDISAEMKNEIFFNDETGYPKYKTGDGTRQTYGVKVMNGDIYCYTCEYPEYADNADCWVRISDLEGISIADVAECVANYTESTK